MPDWVTEEFLKWLRQCPEQQLLLGTDDEFQTITFQFMIENKEE
tara:strand:- start:210 stop:341 length:132 start_codon:yes stop_codon:yes gene_type:complete